MDTDTDAIDPTVAAHLARMHHAYRAKIDLAVRTGHELRVRELADTYTDEALTFVTAYDSEAARDRPRR